MDRNTGEPLPEGAAGVLVFTTLTKKAMPVLRYWTNDICSLHYDKGGKRTHIKMGQIMGRADDMLIIRGVNLFHTQVEAVLEDFGKLSTNYQLIVNTRGNMDVVTVNVELEPVFFGEAGVADLSAEGIASHSHLHSLYHSLQKKIKDNTGLSMSVQLMAPGEIPRSEGGKLNRIIDQRKKG